MKRVLNPKLNNDKIVTIEYSSTKEELEYKLEERNQNETNQWEETVKNKGFQTLILGQARDWFIQNSQQRT